MNSVTRNMEINQNVIHSALQTTIVFVSSVAERIVVTTVEDDNNYIYIYILVLIFSLKNIYFRTKIIKS